MILRDNVFVIVIMMPLPSKIHTHIISDSKRSLLPVFIKKFHMGTVRKRNKWMASKIQRFLYTQNKKLRILLNP